ncbi:hypothetical protein Pla123a_03330 [Posidoniimonas polymericola]|uniref:Uncharacterized protein n=1 Tax=Posidoniimonas polymericola TaxID=2528002 RepID=A0A5C5ZEE2_9BACT|nr:hypothetical protein [Posidoniimonas polymericola]TWT85526.1 hypothetical protein Pla123a_03330 [Posidoniimonas polymericola]
MTKPKPPTTIQTGSLSGEFRLEGDRFLQRYLIGGAELLACHAPTPPLTGPVFQEVYEQPTPTGGSIAFLTGMAEGRYWSASIEAGGIDAGSDGAHSNESAPGGRLSFDLACRLKHTRGHVAAEYKLGEGVEATLAGGELTLQISGRPTAVVRPVGIEGHPTAQVMLADRSVVLAPGERSEGDPRWAFEIVAS